MRVPSVLCVLAYWACSFPGERSSSVPDWERVPVSIELRVAQTVPAPGLTPAAVYAEGDTVYLRSQVRLSTTHIARVETVTQPHGLVLRVWLKAEGVTRLLELTSEHIGDRLAVLINSQVTSAAPIIEALGSTPEMPLLISLRLEPKNASQLAKAVSETWPIRD